MQSSDGRRPVYDLNLVAWQIRYSLYECVAVALVFEGLGSGTFHLCPTADNFQFDTAFMFFIATLLCGVVVSIIASASAPWHCRLAGNSAVRFGWPTKLGYKPITKFDKPITKFGYTPITKFGYEPITKFGYKPITKFGYKPMTKFGYEPITKMSVVFD